ncbi:hypothetical protein HanIR_Chr09g0436981 [Helianthus annuus]|nr:hypothetical protein HanIR_Chr09g0436981 [Helianthus annuus]
MFLKLIGTLSYLFFSFSTTLSASLPPLVSFTTLIPPNGTPKIFQILSFPTFICLSLRLICIFSVSNLSTTKCVRDAVISLTFSLTFFQNPFS